MTENFFCSWGVTTAAVVAKAPAVSNVLPTERHRNVAVMADQGLDAYVNLDGADEEFAFF